MSGKSQECDTGLEVISDSHELVLGVQSFIDILDTEAIALISFPAAPGAVRPTKVARADTQPVDLLSVPASSNKGETATP